MTTGTDEDPRFVFIEHKGRRGSVARKEQSSVRRHIAYQTSKKTHSDENVHQRQLVRQPSREVQRNDDSDEIKRAKNTPLYESSLSLCGVSSLPVRNSRDLQLIDYLVLRLWPGFPQGVRGSGNEFPAFWLPRCVDNTALFNAILFAASSHLASRMIITGGYLQDSRELLVLQTDAITAMRRQVQSCSISQCNACLDDLLMICICLATSVQEGNLITTKDPTPFFPVLTSGHWLDTYGTFIGDNVHWDAIFQLLNQCGGIKQVKSFGLPWIITCAALTKVSATLSQPLYPMLDVEGNPSTMKTFAEFDADNFSRAFYPFYGHGFNVLRSLGMPEEVVDTFISLGDFSATLDAYCTGRIPKLDLDDILDSRNVVMHKLLSLPSTVQSADPNTCSCAFIDSDTCLSIYQACRWAAQLYGIMVVLPIPRSRWAREQAISQIQHHLSSFRPGKETRQFWKLEMWCVTVAGSSSYSKDQRQWFGERACLLAQYLDIQIWQEIEAMLGEFAWVSNICKPAALEFCFCRDHPVSTPF